MKTWFKLIAAAILLGALAGHLLIPQLVKVDHIREQITAQLSEKLGRPVEIESVRWHWFLFPHLSLYNAKIHYDEAEFNLPEARLYPNWLSLFGAEVEVGKVVLKRPEITLRIKGDFSESLPEFTLPKLKVVIDEGTLHMQSLTPIFGVVAKTFDLTDLSASAKLAPGHIAFQLKSKSSFSKSLKLSGTYALKERQYTLETAWEELRLHHAITSTVHGTLVPVDSTANFKAKLSGTGTDTVIADIKGELPCFLYRPKNEKLLFDCGLVDLRLEKRGGDLAVTIRELDMKEPGLSLQGTVKRTVAGGTEPIWQLDLRGDNLNVTKIRKASLTLFGDDIIVRDLFDILRGGVAKNATYTFKGRAQDFEYLKYQVIAAEAVDGTVHIPEANLTIEEVNGKVLIKDGHLMVTEADGRLGQSRGRNCTVNLGLLETMHNPPFSLDVDIDAEATDLIAVLHDLVPYEAFRKELLTFSEVEGSGSGHLHIGHTLDEFDVEVDVKAMDVRGRYGRLASPFHVQRGTLRIAPQMITWNGVMASLGNHRIQNITGSLAWQQEPQLHIENLHASLDGGTLLADLGHYKVVADYLAPVITTLSGDILVSKGTFDGPAFDYEKWRYNATATLRNVGWKSPLLNGIPVNGQSGEITLSDKEIQVGRNEARLLKSNLTMDGVLRHHLLTNWQGWVGLSGNLTEEFGPWIRKRQWLPAAAMPRLPAKIKGLRLEWDEKNFSASGTLVAGGVSLKRPPELTFTTKSSGQNPLAMTVEVAEQDRRAKLHLDLLDQNPETMRLTWQGELQALALKRLLADSSLLTGSIKGNCTLTVPPEPGAPSFTGQLNANGFRVPLEEDGSEYLTFRELSLAGGQGKATIQRLILAVNDQEQLSLKGDVSATPAGLLLALNLTSPQLTRQGALDFADQLKKLRSKAGGQEQGEKKTDGRTITGTVRFTLEKFISGPKEDEPDDAASLVWSPLKGVLYLKPQGRMSAEIESAKLCCMETKGTWYSEPAMGMSHFTLATTCPTPPRFEEVLPCIGIKQNVVQGDFNLNADLYGDLDFWHSGRATVTSGTGRILRMKLLSKIFSIVNLTDLFTSNGFPNFEEKGFAYSELTLETHIKENTLFIDKAVVRGEGLNLFARGKLNLGTRQADITLLIAPFKTLDAIVSKIPLVGRIIGGKEAAIITIPVGIKGDIRDPNITVLAPDAVGEGMLNLVKNTLLLPFHILSPVLPGTSPEGAR